MLKRFLKFENNKDLKTHFLLINNAVALLLVLWRSFGSTKIKYFNEMPNHYNKTYFCVVVKIICLFRQNQLQNF